MIQNSSVDDFLNDFYSESFVFGEFVDIDSLGYRVSEVIVGDDEIARGYIVQDNSGTFLYFLDVDRDNFISTSFDVIYDELNEFTNIDEQEMYPLTNEFDVIGFLNFDYQDPTEWSGRPFWGEHCDQWMDGSDEWQKCCKYRFWIRTSCADDTLVTQHDPRDF